MTLAGAGQSRDRLLPDPIARWAEPHLLRADRFGDVYFSRSGGAAEKSHVFLDGVGLPAAWGAADAFVIGELGFGTGLNFLLTWERWRRTRRSGGRLHYFAVEGYPLTPTELGHATAIWPELTALAAALRAVYPEPQPGFHRLFPTIEGESDVHLTLACGEVSAMLTAAEASVDAWYLDGFAPDRNPEMWQPAVFAEMARLSHGAGDGKAATQVATYSVAGGVRQGLAAAGFEIDRAPGFGAKREMLRGSFRGPQTASRLPPWFAHATPRPSAGRAAIIGGGIAGVAVAAALRRRKWEVAIVERNAEVAAEASGVPAAVLMPRMTADPSLDSRFFAAAWRFAIQDLKTHPDVGATQCGTLQLSGAPSRFAALARQQVLAATLVRPVSAQEASEIAGCRIDREALYFPDGGWLSGARFCRSVGDRAIHLFENNVAEIIARDHALSLRDRTAKICADSDIVVIAGALGSLRLSQSAWLPLAARRGQVTLAGPSPTSAALRSVLVYGGYITPAAIGGRHCIGATFDWVGDAGQSQAVDAEDHQRNLAELAQALPGLALELRATDHAGWAALRCVSPDHFPLAGPLPDHAAYVRDYALLRHGQRWARYRQATYHPGLYVLTGLGARGFTTAPLAAELLASQIAGEPWPLERDLALALHPARFVVRDLRRKRT